MKENGLEPRRGAGVHLPNTARSALLRLVWVDFQWTIILLLVFWSSLLRHKSSKKWTLRWGRREVHLNNYANFRHLLLPLPPFPRKKRSIYMKMNAESSYSCPWHPLLLTSHPSPPLITKTNITGSLYLNFLGYASCVIFFFIAFPLGRSRDKASTPQIFFQLFPRPYVSDIRDAKTNVDHWLRFSKKGCGKKYPDFKKIDFRNLAWSPCTDM